MESNRTAEVDATPYDELLGLLSSKNAQIGVIGLGYVGLPLASLLHSSGYSVVGYDIDAEKINKLKRGVSYISYMDTGIVKTLSESDHFFPTTDFNQLERCHVLIICLPTPVGSHDEPDMSYVFSTASQISKILRPCTLVVLESTTYPGATDTDLIKILEKSALVVGEDYFVAFSPEREDPANEKYKTCDIPKLVGGVDEKSSILVEQLYKNGGFQKPVRVSSARVAECAKLLENTYRAVNIALVNELKIVFESMDVDIWEVLDAAGTKPFGFQRFNPGPGIGGHCIPVDPFYLTWKAKETGTPCSFIELAEKTNTRMPFRVVDRTQDALNEDMKCVKGSCVLLLGIAYKPNVDDIREAPSLVVWTKLLELGANVEYHDPYVPVICHTRKHPQLAMEESVTKGELSSRIHKYDVIILVTNHSCFGKYSFLNGFKGIVIDTRNQIPRHNGLRVVMA
ncbi:UDP-N-acetyl-D-glucosamine 6-dehydrogenase [Gracilariopsis chorda]|uniref:UDP-N-acetyl-D-glucosamine 6-dehydrogenase n=1 Tax=Gracilariopsis chorda TaxID=448386 RepID=A0A2V3J2U1_9FLOR|nr:UDP-N-acetyl-D-glucosamine 6-dehydrogenase [Gracilariopsis chorda]|eukprot:PXF48694.1 UDP-N-acetyl-D-glucosamine 6-dehydrogenase [Gracilariopsis chorda]